MIALCASKLQEKIIEKGFTTRTLAKLMNIERTCMYRKINNVSKLTIGEVMMLKTILDLSDSEAITIFLEV